MDLTLLGPIVIAVEYFGDLRLESVDKLVHILLEHFAAPRGNFQAFRLVLLLEVIDVAPIGGRFLLPGLVLDEGLGDVGKAGLRRAGDENIITGLLHAHAELYGVDRAFLADYTIFEDLQ